MATSGSFSSNIVSSLSSSTPRSIKVTWNIISTNIANNTSTLKYEISTANGSTDNYVYAYSIKVVINGTTINVITSKTSVKGTTILKTGNITIAHNTDGTKSVAVSISAALYSSSVNSTYSGTITLNTIPRASNISTAENRVIGDTCRVSWTPYSKSFYYKVKISLNGNSYTSPALHPNQTTKYTYNGCELVPGWAKYFTNSKSGTATAYLYTYSNSACTTQIGSVSSKTFTVSIPSTVPTALKPSITNSKIEIINSHWGLAVAGVSKAKITAEAIGKENAKINSFKITGDYSTTQTGSSLNYTGGTLTPGNKTFKIIATDSRGVVSDEQTLISDDVKPYTKPNITLFSVYRKQNDDSKIIIKANWNITAIGDNKATVSLYYKSSDKSTWSSSDKYTGTIPKNTNIELSGFKADKSYNFKLELKDELFSAIPQESFVQTMAVTMDFKAGGKGVAVGKICERDGFEIGMPMMFYANNIPAISNSYLTLPQISHMSTVLTTGADIDDYTTPGIYTILGKNIDSSNLPFANDSVLSKASSISISLEVLPCRSNSIMLQRITYINGSGCKVCVRYWRPATTGAENTWTEWVTISDTFKRTLWSGAYYMTDSESQTVTLSEPISQQSKGIVLVFSYYNQTDKIAEDVQFKEFFVPKEIIADKPGKGHCFDMTSHCFGNLCTKYLYISNTWIKGHKDNGLTGTAANGITYNNKYFVLRYVIGV